MAESWHDLGVVPEKVKANGEFRALCPDCSPEHRGKAKTLGGNVETGAYHCFRCGLKGRIGGKDDRDGAWRERMREAEQAKRDAQRHAAVQARDLLAGSSPCLWHPYLTSKRILPLGVRERDGVLLVPMSEPGSETVLNVQRISAAGEKRFMRDGRVSGLAYRIAPKDGTAHPEIFIAEGFATAVTWHMHYRPGAETYVALNAGNLKPVAVAIRAICPDRELVLVADNDQWTEGNPGLAKAREAAAVVGARVLSPKFDGLDTSGRPTDFNDAWILQRQAREQASG